MWVRTPLSLKGYSRFYTHTCWPFAQTLHMQAVFLQRFMRCTVLIMSERLAESVERSLFVSAACDCRGLELITSPRWNVSWLENAIFT